MVVTSLEVSGISWGNEQMPYLEANLGKLGGIEKEAAVEDEGWLCHVVINRLPVENDKVFPLGGDHNSLSFIAGINSRCSNMHLLPY